MGNPSPAFFCWASGLLSSVLDNIPTYRSFLYAPFAPFINQDTIKLVQYLVQNGVRISPAFLNQSARLISRFKNTIPRLASQHIGAKEVRSPS